MHQTILIPTDFSVESLNLVKQALHDHSDQRMNILLVHGVDTSYSVTDLLFFSKSVIYKELATKEFEEACDLLRSHYSKEINSLRFDLFTGLTQNAFNNFLEANNVFKTYLPEDYSFVHSKRMSTDLLRFIKRNNDVIKELVSWTPFRKDESAFVQLIQG